MEEIGIFLNGNVKTFDDPVRSEVRWALNIGRVLKWAGYNPVYINNGCYNLEVLDNDIPVIEFGNPKRRNLNILLNLPWSFNGESCDSIAGSAKHCVHFNFMLNVKNALCSHTVAYPYRTTKFNLSGNHRLAFIPYPSPIQTFKQQQQQLLTIPPLWVWSSRWGFGAGPWEDTLRPTFYGVELAAKKTNAKLIIIESSQAKFNQSMLNGVNVTTVTDPSYYENCQILNKSELSLRTPILFGNQLESVTLGSCPIIFDDVVDQERGILVDRARELKLILNSNIIDSKQICDQLVQLSRDQNFRVKTLLSYQDYLKDHEWNNVVKKLIEMLEPTGDKT